MNPPRTLNGENFGNGVGYRVSACRKRLRVSRTTHRTSASVRGDEQPKEIESFSIRNDNRRAVLATSGAQEEAEGT